MRRCCKAAQRAVAVRQVRRAACRPVQGGRGRRGRAHPGFSRRRDPSGSLTTAGRARRAARRRHSGPSAAPGGRRQSGADGSARASEPRPRVEPNVEPSAESIASSPGRSGPAGIACPAAAAHRVAGKRCSHATAAARLPTATQGRYLGGAGGARFRSTGSRSIERVIRAASRRDAPPCRPDRLRGQVAAASTGKPETALAAGGPATRVAAESGATQPVQARAARGAGGVSSRAAPSEPTRSAPQRGRKAKTKAATRTTGRRESAQTAAAGPR